MIRGAGKSAQDIIEETKSEKNFKEAARKLGASVSQALVKQSRGQEPENTDSKGGSGLLGSVTKSLTLVFSVMLLLKGFSKAKSKPPSNSMDQSKQSTAESSGKTYARVSDL